MLYSHAIRISIHPWALDLAMTSNLATAEQPTNFLSTLNSVLKYWRGHRGCTTIEYTWTQHTLKLKQISARKPLLQNNKRTECLRVNMWTNAGHSFAYLKELLILRWWFGGFLFSIGAIHRVSSRTACGKLIFKTLIRNLYLVRLTFNSVNRSMLRQNMSSTG